jgi:site-specific recombinase XerD
VFGGLVYSTYANKALAQWIGAAGITRNITFHLARHAFATLFVPSGSDIYTVSNMLTRENVATSFIVDDFFLTHSIFIRIFASTRLSNKIA